MQALSLSTTLIDREYLLDLFYQIELKDKLARKWRSKCLCSQSLRDAQRAVNEVRRERRLVVGLAHAHKFDVRELWDEVDEMLLDCME